jgi:hypothetical protein
MQKDVMSEATDQVMWISLKCDSRARYTLARVVQINSVSGGFGMHRVLIVSVLGVCLAGGACSRNRGDAKARPSLTDVAGATADKGHVDITAV